MTSDMTSDQAGSASLIFNAVAFERTSSYLSPDAVASYLETFAQRCHTLMQDLDTSGALARDGERLAEAAHILAGCVGMFGFERLAVISRRFEPMAKCGAADEPDLAALRCALRATTETLRRLEHDPT